MYDFGLMLKQIRKGKNLTQKQLASKIDVSEATISKYESNIVYPPLDKLRSLSSVLRVSLDELCGTEGRENVSLYGLSGEQADIIRTLIDIFRNQNDNVKMTMNQKQYAILGKITAEISQNGGK